MFDLSFPLSSTTSFSTSPFFFSFSVYIYSSLSEQGSGSGWRDGVLSVYVSFNTLLPVSGVIFILGAKSFHRFPVKKSTTIMISSNFMAKK